MMLILGAAIVIALTSLLLVCGVVRRRTAYCTYSTAADASGQQFEATVRAAVRCAHDALLTESALRLWSENRCEEAEPLLREVWGARGEVLGAHHADTLSAMGSLASILQDLGRFDEAEPLLRDALEARRTALGPRHPDTLMSLGNLGALLQAQGKLDEAAPLFREDLQTSRATLGDRHPNTLVSISNFAAVLHEKGDDLGARILFAEAVDGAKAVLGEAHPDTQTYLHWLHSVNRKLYYDGALTTDERWL